MTDWAAATMLLGESMARAAVAAHGGGLDRLDGFNGGDAVLGEEVEAVDLVEKGGVAGVALELGVAGLDLGDQVAWGDCWRNALHTLNSFHFLPFFPFLIALPFFLEDSFDDVAEGVVVDAGGGFGGGLGGLTREVVGTYGEVEL